MFDKYFLLNKIVNILEKNEFNTFITHGCFDIAARKENILLIKALTNVDALDKEQALSLQAISHFLSACPFVVSMRNNRGSLDNRIVYSRFNLPIVTLKLFEEMLTDDITTIQSSKGRHTTEIDSTLLKERRKELGYSLSRLSEIADISKKALYEIENKRVEPTEKTVKKLENLLDVSLKLPFEMKTSEAVYLKPRNEFQEKVSEKFAGIGVDNSAVYSAPFEIVGRETSPLITTLSENTVRIKKEATAVRKLSGIFSSHAVFITKKSIEKSVEGIPVVLEEELLEIESSKELEDIMSEKEA